MQNPEVFCRYAPSLGALEDSPEKAWGTTPYVWWKHRDKQCVFTGLYDLRDYIALWWHRGESWVFWCGSDILNLKNGFVANDGKLMWLSVLFKDRFTTLIKKILSKNSHWVENTWEKEQLESMGIKVDGVRQSFMGDPTLFHISYKWKERPQVYLSASEGRQEEYGWGKIESIAGYLPWMDFHLYGAKWNTNHNNVVVHGRVPKIVMNNEIAQFQIGLRLNETDGFSEVLAKAVLMGQYAVGKIEHPCIPSFDNDISLVTLLHSLGKKKEPNVYTRNYYLKNLNDFPWVNQNYGENTYNRKRGSRNSITRSIE